MKRTSRTTSVLSVLRALIAVIAALTLTACGSSSSSSTGSSGSAGKDFNSADVSFTQSMIPHHKQAVEMAAMANTQAASVQVKKLATSIEGAQGPEIKKMQGWLKDWGKAASGGSMAGMDHSSSMMPGMMSAKDMISLKNATGAAFDKMWLTMMIAHHTGAIDMAKTEQAKGKNAAAKALAADIEKAQTEQITQMKKLLAS